MLRGSSRHTPRMLPHLWLQATFVGLSGTSVQTCVYVGVRILLAGVLFASVHKLVSTCVRLCSREPLGCQVRHFQHSMTNWSVRLGACCFPAVHGPRSCDFLSAWSRSKQHFTSDHQGIMPQGNNTRATPQLNHKVSAFVEMHIPWQRFVTVSGQ